MSESKILKEKLKRYNLTLKDLAENLGFQPDYFSKATSIQRCKGLSDLISTIESTNKAASNSH